MNRQSMRLLAICLLTLHTVTASSATAQPARTQPISVTARAIPFDSDKPEQTRFGKLEWLGTLQLTSPNRKFGGFSGLIIDKTGTRLLAVSDEANVLSAAIQYENGRPVGLRDTRLGPIRGLRGQTFASKRNSDSEAIAMATPGTLRG
ncbi:MAG: esterase-like activity of phytase family protein, partial [Pseudomonadota bacterium]